MCIVKLPVLPISLRDTLRPLMRAHARDLTPETADTLNNSHHRFLLKNLTEEASHRRAHCKTPVRPHVRDSIHITLETSNHSLPLRNLTPETSLQNHLIKKPSLQTSLYFMLETTFQRLQMNHIRNLTPQTLI